MSENKIGLSSENRKLLVALLFAILLIWGPIEPYGMIVRTAYLVVLPPLLWFGLGYFTKDLDIDKSTNDRLTRAIAGILAGAFFVGAYLSFTAPYHTACTQEVQTRDGTECVGDYVGVKGGDRAGAFMLILFGGIASWYAVAKHDEKES